ncbi:MAG: alpha/beta-type small acid-soluble spore protein [Bacilli bacterium]|nr:alpha/beta-type small acid-soluble spore protein [Bacilli bacterium]
MPRNANKLLVPGCKQALDQMKMEIANEFGVTLGPDTASRLNGSVGGEITKRLVAQAQSQLSQANIQSR